MGTVWILTDERYLGQRMPAALLAELGRRSVRRRVVVADRLVVEPGPEDRSPWAELAAGDVVVTRTRNRLALALLRGAERPGVTVLPSWESVAVVRNKVRACQVLAASGVPMPRTYFAHGPALLGTLPSTAFPLLLKPHLGSNGDGVVVVRDAAELDGVEWPEEMVVAQQFVDVGFVDLKLYAVADAVWAVRKRSPLAARESARRGVEPADVTPELAELAATCRAAFGLDLLGVDVLESEQGPLVVDVNEFPNYTGVPEAGAAIADLVLASVGGTSEEACCAR